MKYSYQHEINIFIEKQNHPMLPFTTDANQSMKASIVNLVCCIESKTCAHQRRQTTIVTNATVSSNSNDVIKSQRAWAKINSSRRSWIGLTENSSRA